MGVLMIVWIPNLVITLMFQDGDSTGDLVHSTGIFLIAAQGLLDSTVYGLNTKELQKFMTGVCCCKHNPLIEEDANDVPYPQPDGSLQDFSDLNTPFTRMSSLTPYNTGIYALLLGLSRVAAESACIGFYVCRKPRF